MQAGDWISLQVLACLTEFGTDLIPKLKLMLE